MKTEFYNPSSIEIDFAKALQSLKDEIDQKLNGNKIISIENKTKKDNPMLYFKLEDNDGDQHELVLKLIQRPDE